MLDRSETFCKVCQDAVDTIFDLDLRQGSRQAIGGRRTTTVEKKAEVAISVNKLPAK